MNGSWQNYKRSQSQFILLTIRSNLFHANSSLRFQKVLFDINRSGCSCHNPPSATLHYYYTQLTALYSTSDGFLNPSLTPKWNICLHRPRWDKLSRVITQTPGRWLSRVQNLTWNFFTCRIFFFLPPHTIRFTTVIIWTGCKATQEYVSFFPTTFKLQPQLRKLEKWWRLFQRECLRLRHNGVQLSRTEPLAEPLNFYGDILLCFEKGLLKCISTTHFLKKDRARIRNIAMEEKKRRKERKKSRMQSFFKKASPSPLEISPSLFADDLMLQSSIYFFFFSPPLLLRLFLLP